MTAFGEDRRGLRHPQAHGVEMTLFVLAWMPHWQVGLQERQRHPDATFADVLRFFYLPGSFDTSWKV
jgi:hypothetical protein